MQDIETTRRVGAYLAALGSVQGAFPDLSSTFVAKKSIACASSSLGMFFFSSEKAKIMHRDFAVFPG